MNLSHLARLASGLSLLAMIALLPVDASAAKKSRLPKPGEFNPQHETVELFQAMKDKVLVLYHDTATRHMSFRAHDLDSLLSTQAQ